MKKAPNYPKEAIEEQIPLDHYVRLNPRYIYVDQIFDSAVYSSDTVVKGLTNSIEMSERDGDEFKTVVEWLDPNSSPENFEELEKRFKNSDGSQNVVKVCVDAYTKLQPYFKEGNPALADTELKFNTEESFWNQEEIAFNRLAIDPDDEQARIWIQLATGSETRLNDGHTFSRLCK